MTLSRINLSHDARAASFKLAAALSLALAMTASSSAAEVIFNYAGTPNLRNDGGQVVGASFTGFGQTLNSLGFYDHGGDGIAASYLLGIWDTLTQTLLASTTVTPSSPLIGDFRYAPIPAVTLGASQIFTIGVLLPAVLNDIWLDQVFLGLGAGYTGAGTGQYLASGTLVYPTTLDSSAYYVVNASDAIISVPEPSTLILSGIGIASLLALILCWRK